MPRTHRFTAGMGRALVVASLMACTAPAAAGESILEALRQSRPLVDLRYRHETVDQDGFDDPARASTLRARVGIRTGEWVRFYALFEAETLRTIGDDAYNSTRNGRVEFPVVADPEDTEVNQVYVGYRGVEGMDFRLGRQRITLDNHRHIGNVGWRQLEQTYDAFSASGRWDRWTGFYGRLNNANRIFGEGHPDPLRADTNLTGDLLNGSVETPIGTIVAFTYLIGNDTMPSASHKEIGLRIAGDHAFSDRLTVGWAGEYADQSDYKGGADVIDAQYHQIEAFVEWPRVKVLAGREVLGGDGTWGYFTPLATLHAFNGWADVFAAGTPPEGLTDAYLSVSGRVAGIDLLGVYHDFSADEGGADWGREINLQAERSFGDSTRVTLKYADYDADDFFVDIRKVWVMLGFSI